jgi:hypothetical protein
MKKGLEVKDGHIIFSRHVKPIISSTTYGDRLIHVCQDIMKDGSVVFSSFLSKKNGRVQRAGHMKASEDEAILAAKEVARG